MKKAYSGYIKDKKKLLSTSSGGVATALSECIIREGGCVFGVRYSEDFYNAEYCCAETIEELDQLKGSKYTNSIKGKIYTLLEEKLLNKQTVLYIGLGCDIGAVRTYCSKRNIDTSRLYTIDILCHGTAINGVQKSFITELENRYQSKLIGFTIRYKKNGWTPFYIKAKFLNGNEFVTPFNSSDYGKAFRAVARPACTRCPFKGENHKGDLCIGDYWGLKNYMPGWNENGVSIMITQTAKGKELLNMLDESFSIREEKFRAALKGNSMYFRSRKQANDYEKFVQDLNEKGLGYAVAQLTEPGPSLLHKLREMLKCMNRK